MRRLLIICAVLCMGGTVEAQCASGRCEARPVSKAALVRVVQPVRKLRQRTAHRRQLLRCRICRHCH